MRQHSFLLTSVVIAFLAVVENAWGQSAEPSRPSQTEVLITKLHEPLYPMVARTAHIYGDVALTLQIRQDGTVQSVEFVSGPPLLKQAAMDSARESQFECRGCNEPLTPYPLVYSFQLSTNGDCCSPLSGPQVSWTGNHILITASTVCTCDPAGVIKARSIKCLYLWKCATR
jgi:hypothetical protein